MPQFDSIFHAKALSLQSHVPLYLQLQSVLRQAINEGVLVTGDALPPEREIALRCAVSRVTVRKALAALVEQKILVQQQGSGTYIAPHLAKVEQSVSLLASFSQEARNRGVSPSVRWLERTIETATAQEAMLFGLSPNQNVTRLKRIRYADDTPLALETAVLPNHFVPNPHEIEESLYLYLKERKIYPVRALQRISATNLSAAEAELLTVEPGDAALLIQRTSYLSDGRQLEFTQSKYRGDAYDFVAELKV